MKRFILITLAILLVGFFIFHFIAANNAEEQIDRTIQMQADSVSVPMSVSYSSIDVSPFSGDIELKDVTVVVRSNIERAATVHLDLGYFDFLNIMFGGVEYGLKQIESGDVHFNKLSYLNRETLQEGSLASADLTYNGELLDGIRTLIFDEPLGSSHQIKLSGADFSYSKPNSTVGSFKSDSAFIEFSTPETGKKSEASNTTIELREIVWNPPSCFSKKYGFFIQGFGYQLDSLPITNITSTFSFADNHSIQISDGQTETELFTILFDGQVVKDTTWINARFNPLSVQVSDLSEDFQNVLNNIEQLLGTSFPKSQNKIKFQLVGPISNPRIARSR